MSPLPVKHPPSFFDPKRKVGVGLTKKIQAVSGNWNKFYELLRSTGSPEKEINMIDNMVHVELVSDQPRKGIVERLMARRRTVQKEIEQKEIDQWTVANHNVIPTRQSVRV